MSFFYPAWLKFNLLVLWDILVQPTMKHVNPFHANDLFWDCIYYVLARKWQGSTMVGRPAIKYFRIWSVYIGLRCTFQSGLRSFCKPWSKKIVLNIWTLIPTQRYKQLSGYDTEYRSSSPRVFFTIAALENLEISDAIIFQ